MLRVDGMVMKGGVGRGDVVGGWDSDGGRSGGCGG